MKIAPNSRPASPPRWAQKLLRWYCRPDLLEDLEGDFNEYFERNLKTKGARRARFIYVLDVLKFFRPYTVRKPSFLTFFIHWLMLGSYFKTSRRSLVRNKLFSAINIIGLAVSMSVGLLVIAFLADLFAYDQFHEKKHRTYRLLTRNELADKTVMNFASTSLKAGFKLRETIPGVEDVALIRRGFYSDARVNDETVIPLEATWADGSFFKVFTFPLLKGNPATALNEPYSLVVTEKTARKLFGDADALGKTVRFDTLNYTVTGVLKDIPKLSHLRFEALVSLPSVLGQKADSDGGILDWGNIYQNYVYLTVPENANLQAIQAGLDQLSRAENARLDRQKITLSLQPMDDIVFGGRLSNEIGVSIPTPVAWVLVGLALVVILSACFNYTNLSIARSIRRSREVGIRKIVGALKTHVLGQFMAESVIISVMALVLSFLLFLLLRTQFMALAPQLADVVSLELSPWLLLYFLLLAIGVGLAAGFLPALFFSRLQAVQVLKDASSLRVFRHVNMRKTLIFTQYTFSLIFITTTLIGYKQYRGFLSFDLGFTTENILNIRMQGNKSTLLKKELAEIPAVSQIATSRMITSLGSLYGATLKYKEKDKQDSAKVWINFVDENYLPLHRHRFLAGTNFKNRPTSGNETEVIVNEQVLKRFNLADRNPSKAVGKQVIMDDKPLTIVGVLKDFHYGTMDQKIEPTVFRYSAEESGGYLNVGIQSDDYPAALASIESAWQKIDRVHPLDAKFYDDQIEDAYRQFEVMVKVIGFITFLAICIASMGLFGMVVFTTETRLKEISIRKVMGASEGSLIFQLSKGFLLLLVMAALVALPVTYFFFDQFVLTKFVYHQPIGVSELVISVLVVMALAFLLIGSQTLKAARSNPAKVLKNE
ncbi:ABC-type antimicrobial peptide transport system permease subunit [Larkinella arboricola]|uniref:ABC-type antimicrobial peptide transport system permease subunit n=1 Tax=Larkinella arboricola TaxID=643671 RepID=A0A327X3D5_LARAB|nr:ABC transporter permease [Larkinella arboricola]RAK00189.1 ABC-type antimicrobial peptide transport system permease subunit [Larkinella arboricola]